MWVMKSTYVSGFTQMSGNRAWKLTSKPRRSDYIYVHISVVLATGLNYPKMQLQGFGVFLTSTPMAIAD
jgi:hypothetical protein